MSCKPDMSLQGLNFVLTPSDYSNKCIDSCVCAYFFSRFTSLVALKMCMQMAEC